MIDEFTKTPDSNLNASQGTPTGKVLRRYCYKSSDIYNVS